MQRTITQKRVFSLCTATILAGCIFLGATACGQEASADSANTAKTGYNAEWSDILSDVSNAPPNGSSYSSSETTQKYEHISVITDDMDVPDIHYGLPSAVEQEPVDQQIFYGDISELDEMLDGEADKTDADAQDVNATDSEPGQTDEQTISEADDSVPADNQSADTNNSADTNESASSSQDESANTDNVSTPSNSSNDTTDANAENNTSTQTTASANNNGTISTVTQTTTVTQTITYTEGPFPLYNYDWVDGSYLGRVSIPSLGINVAVYNTSAQYITDAVDSANMYYHFGKNWKGEYPIQTILLSDHNYQEFAAFGNISIGDALYIESTDGNTYKYICDSIDRNGYNDGSTIYDCNGYDVTQSGGLWCYTCNDNSLTSITMAHFSPA